MLLLPTWGLSYLVIDRTRFVYGPTDLPTDRHVQSNIHPVLRRGGIISSGSIEYRERSFCWSKLLMGNVEKIHICLTLVEKHELNYFVKFQFVYVKHTCYII